MEVCDRIGGVVLCGGTSSRMGRPKLSLPFGEEVLLQRIVRVMSEVVSPIVVVAAEGQALPELAADVEVLRDRHPDRGPLEGIAVGLAALENTVDAVYVSSCDCPLLSAAFVRCVVESLGSHELAILRDDKFFHPLAAVYRTSLVVRINQLIDADRMRPFFLVEASDSCILPVAELAERGQSLDSLINVNTPDEYAAALAKHSAQLP